MSKASAQADAAAMKTAAEDDFTASFVAARTTFETAFSNYLVVKAAADAMPDDVNIQFVTISNFTGFPITISYFIEDGVTLSGVSADVPNDGAFAVQKGLSFKVDLTAAGLTLAPETSSFIALDDWNLYPDVAWDLALVYLSLAASEGHAATGATARFTPVGPGIDGTQTTITFNGASVIMEDDTAGNGSAHQSYSPNTAHAMADSINAGAPISNPASDDSGHVYLTTDCPGGGVGSGNTITITTTDGTVITNIMIAPGHS
jgi:hypothetical protein